MNANTMVKLNIDEFQTLERFLAVTPPFTQKDDLYKGIIRDSGQIIYLYAIVTEFWKELTSKKIFLNHFPT